MPWAMSKDPQAAYDLSGAIAHLRGVTEGNYIIPGRDGEDNLLVPKYWYRTGITILDEVLQNGGFGSGRIVEIYGPNRTGKSELAQRICESFLRDYDNGVCMYLDQERALDHKKIDSVSVFRENLASDGRPGRFVIDHPAHLEDAFKAILEFVKWFANQCATHRVELPPMLFVLDSLANLQTSQQIDSKFDDVIIAGQARRLNELLPRFKNLMEKFHATMIILNQIREKPGSMAFVEPESPGGQALKFNCDYRVRTSALGKYSLSKGKNSEKGVPASGIRIGFLTKKNKLAIPERSCEIPLLFMRHGNMPSGFSNVWSLFHTLLDAGYIKSSGGAYSLDGDAERFTRKQWYRVFEAMSTPIKGCYYDRKLLPDSPLGKAVRAWSDWMMNPVSDDFVPIGISDGD